MVFWILLLLLLLMAGGSLPVWSHSQSWGYAGPGLAGFLIIALMLWFFFGRG